MEGVFEEMAIEDEVLGKLDDHEKRISNNSKKIEEHDKQITELQLKDVNFEGRFNNIDNQIGEIKNSLTRMENTSLQTTNILMQTLSQVVINTSSANNEIAKEDSKSEKEIIKGKMDNNTKIILKVLGLIGFVIGGIFAAKYGINIPAIM